ncbi:BTAD domain-containing putative transcriptional regulator [Amycolatopsis coloradensis]|uniref:BTAD domain-containing putative transcriptional regulator n=1 Tax=Amycolatopsis coloradensis TaxID=76021 RepID=A0ACD5BPB0_9PSEU
MAVEINGQDVTPSAPKMRRILALLILRRSTPVNMGDLVLELWGNHPPPSARTTVHTYIHKLRCRLFPAHLSKHGFALHTKQQSYFLEMPPQCLDLHRFEYLVQRGESALERGEPRLAVESLREALGLWREPMMSAMETGPLLAAHVTGLEESRLRALELRIGADLQLGRHRELLSELKELVITHPRSEVFHGHLMLALHRCHRRDEALEVYQRFRREMVEEMGLEPSQLLQHAHQAVLAGEPLPDATPLKAQVTTATERPAQLPGDSADFIGRGGLVEDAVMWLTSAGLADVAPRVLSVHGMPGVGKTAFAVRVAQRVRSRFEGGQFYACLGTSGDGARDPADVLNGFLMAAGFPAERLPADREDKAALFRTWTSMKRVLVVLDDVGSAEQIRPLMPAGPRCAVVVTTRRGIHPATGSRLVCLDPLEPSESTGLLSAMIGTERIAGEREQVDRIVQLCGGLPLAVRAVGAQLRSVSGWPIGTVLHQLENGARRLDALSFHDLDVRGRIAGSYHVIPRPAQLALQKFATLGKTTLTQAEATSLLGYDRLESGRILLTLVDHGLLRISGEADSTVSYELHPLIRCYAEEIVADRTQRHPVIRRHRPRFCARRPRTIMRSRRRRPG